MESPLPNLNQRIAGRVRELRESRNLSLDALAGKSGVSRSMISLIERGESSPTAVVLEKLAAALGVMLASLFDSASPVQSPVGPLLRRKDQTEWTDPASGYLRRNVSPSHAQQLIRLVEICFPPGARVAFEYSERDVHLYQQVWVLEGAINIRVGSELHKLAKGDCLAMQLDCPTMFYNPTQKSTRYVVVTTTGPR